MTVVYNGCQKRSDDSVCTSPRCICANRSDDGVTCTDTIAGEIDESDEEAD